MQATATPHRQRPETTAPPPAPRAVPTPAASTAPGPPAGPVVLLAPDERQLLLLLAEGLPLDAIARRLCTSSRTLRRRIRVLCDRIGVRTPLQAAVWAARRGLI